MCASGDQFESTLGQRVEYQGYYGTIRFAGTLAGQSGFWIGVEWDDPSRGKHDGSHSGVSYFKTRHPTSGSFVRPAKLNFGVSCAEAIKRRYGKVEGSTAGVDEEAMAELIKEFNIPFIEMVGFDKVNSQQSQFENLRVVHLGGELIKSAGETNELSNMCPLASELLLSNTLISSWKVVGDIAVQFKQLTHLDVSNNRLAIPNQEEKHIMKNCFKSLQKLILNNLEFTWDEILECAIMWPQISVLSAQSNRICSLESPQFGLLSNLTSLYLQMNPIKDWSYVNKLGNLVSLQELHLGETGMQTIFFPGEKNTRLFPSLKELYLQSNKINEWFSINELNKLSALESLHLLFNPIIEKEKAWQIIVAKVKNLQKLNGTEIQGPERRGCEYDYMKFFGRDWVTAQSDLALLQTFLDQHPRYQELVKRHGSVTEEDFTSKPAPLKSRLINIKIFCRKEADMPQFQKRVPRNMTVQKLSGLVQKLINTGGCMPALRAISTKAPDVEILLDKDMQDLSYYSVEDGDSIAVSW